MRVKKGKPYGVFGLLLLCSVMLVLVSCVRSQDTEHPEQEDFPEIRIGIARLEPFIYVDYSGNYAGIDAEIAAEACRRAGYRPVFKEIPWSERDEYLFDGSVDCLWTAFAMDWHEQDYLWTDSYLSSDMVVLVEERYPSKTLDDFDGPGGIAVCVGSAAEEVLTRKANASAAHIEMIHAYGSVSMASISFVKGYTDALASYEIVLRQLIHDNPGQYHYLGEPIMTAHLGVAFAKDGNREMVQKLSEALESMKKDGSISAITKKYEMVLWEQEEESADDAS